MIFNKRAALIEFNFLKGEKIFKRGKIKPKTNRFIDPQKKVRRKMFSSLFFGGVKECVNFCFGCVL